MQKECAVHHGAEARKWQGRHIDTLSTRGIRLDTVPGEYQVNFCYGAEATAYFTEEDLHNALA